MRGAIPSPNIWQHPATYELENRAADPGGLIEAAMRHQADWVGRVVLDVGCGTGFHLPRFAATAARVYGVDSNAELAALAVRRTSRLGNVEVRPGTAQASRSPTPRLTWRARGWPTSSGPAASPGWPSSRASYAVAGTRSSSTTTRRARRSAAGSGAAIPGWTRTRSSGSGRGGWRRTPLDIGWRFDDRADLESVVHIEFDRALSEEIVATHRGVEVDYAVNLRTKDF